MEEAATATEPAADPIIAMVDEAGKLDEEIKTKTKRLELLKAEIKKAAKGKDDNGQALAMIGNLYEATVSYTPEFMSFTGIETELEPIDQEMAEKLVPWKVVEAHKEFTGDQEAVKELKAVLVDFPKLFTRLFRHVKGTKERLPNKREITKIARTDVKKHQEVRAVVLEYVETWIADKVNLKAKDK